jgi:hypothetical protein
MYQKGGRHTLPLPSKITGNDRHPSFDRTMEHLPDWEITPAPIPDRHGRRCNVEYLHKHAESLGMWIVSGFTALGLSSTLPESTAAALPHRY